MGTARPKPFVMLYGGYPAANWSGVPGYTCVLCGKHCDNGDLFGEHCKLRHPRPIQMPLPGLILPTAIEAVMTDQSLPEAVDDAEGDPPEEEPYFDSDRHALHAGFFVGALMKAGISVEIICDEEGNYTSDLEVTLPPLDEGLEPIVVSVRVMG